MLLCTVRGCRRPLERHDRRLVCAAGHAFDVARSGYVNLLQPQERRSKNPGDTPEAVAARRRLLETPWGRQMIDAVVAALPLGVSQRLLDAGCGEGSHLEAFRRAYGVEAWGVDISTPAIELAARRFPECHWVVANADRFLPWADGSFEAVSSITARLNPGEFHRLLVPGGRLLIVLPAEDDLIELRAAVLGEGVERDRVERTIASFAPLFAPERRERIALRARLDAAAIEEVMATSYRGLRLRERDRVRALASKDVTLSRDVLVLTAAPA